MERKAILFYALLFASLLAFAAPPVEIKRPEAVADRFVQAWNSHDKNEFDRLFTESAYLVPGVEVRLEGRANIVADFGKAHENWAKTTTIVASDIAVRSLHPDVAVVLFRTGFLSKDGTVKMPRAVLLVVVKQSEGWRIAAMQLAKPNPTNEPRP